jgi:hypothetical protein
MVDWLTLIEMKRQELGKTIDETLRQLNVLINKPQPNLQEISIQANNLVGALKDEVDKIMAAIKTVKPEQTADDGFFRQNYDYGESKYMRMNIDEK